MKTPQRRRKDPRPLIHSVGTLATVPTATGEIPKPVEIVGREPTHEEIACRAYQLYEERGAQHGRDLDDWLQAERELRHVAIGRVIDRALSSEGPYAAA